MPSDHRVSLLILHQAQFSHIPVSYTHLDVYKRQKEMIDIITLYYNVYFQEHWKKTCAFYRGAAIKEKAQFAAADPANFIASLHDDLIYESDTLIMRKQIDFKVQSEEIKEIKIILSAFTYPHLMINIYGNRIKMCIRDRKTACFTLSFSCPKIKVYFPFTFLKETMSIK